MPDPAPANEQAGLTQDAESNDGDDENIFLFIPNLIGYARVILAVVSLYLMPSYPRLCSATYSLSCVLDAFDGYAARYFQQSTRFGTVLDMVTDRCTTTCLLVFLSSAYPQFSFIFQLLICLDLSSHYIHMYATLSMGEAGSSHKDVGKERSWAMHLYYTNKIVLFCVCAANELFFIALYLMAFGSPDSLTVSGVSIAPASLEQAEIFPVGSAGQMEISRFSKFRSNLPLYLVRATAIPMAFKQYVNVIQFMNASLWLAEGDVEERRRKKS